MHLGPGERLLARARPAIADTTTGVADLTGRPASDIERFLADNLDAVRAAVPG